MSSYPGSKGYRVAAGPAKITIANGSGKAHPWHLITTNWSKTHCYGWVDEGSFSMSMEQVFDEFARRVDMEDVRNFSVVFTAAKKSGGDMIAIIRNTVDQISGKIEVKREIETLLAAKKYEYKVMSIIPYAIIAYMRLSFPEFMSYLYGNILGIGVMSVCLGIYAGAYVLGAKMVDIEV